MQHDIGTRPLDIALPSYRGAGVNDGSIKDLAALYGSSRRPLLVSFVNAGAASAKPWLALLPGIKNAPLDVFVVMFRHDGSSFQACGADTDAASAVREAGPGDEAFQSVPVVVDSDGSVARSYLFGLPTPPANKDTWSYLIDPAFCIADKWHSSAVSPAFPISFKHLSLTPDPGPFNGGEPENAKAYLLKRVSNLNAPLVILGAKPVPGTTVRAATEIRKVFFSRPLLEASVTPDKFMLTGPGLIGGPVKAVSASYQGYERAEDGVLLNFPAGPAFKGAGPEGVVLVVSNAPDGVLDTSRGPLAGPNAVKFATEAAFTPAVPVETPPPQPVYQKPVFPGEMKKPEPQPRPEKPVGVREGTGGLPKPQPRKPPEPEPPKVKKPARPAAGKPPKKAAKKAVKKAAKQPVKKAAAKPKKAAKKAPAKKAAKKPVKKPVKKAAAKPKKAAKKAPAKKAAKKAVKKTVKKAAAKKAPVKKASAKKAAQKSKPAKKAPAKPKKVGKKSSAQKAPAKKPAAKKSAPAKKPAPKKAKKK